jgi:hypothetical protein
MPPNAYQRQSNLANPLKAPCSICPSQDKYSQFAQKGLQGPYLIKYLPTLQIAFNLFEVVECKGHFRWGSKVQGSMKYSNLIGWEP